MSGFFGIPNVYQDSSDLLAMVFGNVFYVSIILLFAISIFLRTPTGAAVRTSIMNNLSSANTYYIVVGIVIVLLFYLYYTSSQIDSQNPLWFPVGVDSTQKNEGDVRSRPSIIEPEFTLSSWHYIQNPQRNGQAKISYIYGGSGTPYVLALSDTTMEATWTIPTDKEAVNVTVQGLNLGQWVHLVLVIRRDVADVFIDGKLIKSVPMNSDAVIPKEASVIATPDPENTWKGMVSKVQFFNRAITANEIQGITQSGPLQASLLERIFGFPKSVYSRIAQCTRPE